MLFTILGAAIIGGLTGGAAGAIISGVVAWFIDEDTLVEAIEEEYEDAFYLLIQEKKKEAVKVGIFDALDDSIDEIEIESEEGISDSIYKGQIIYV